MRHFSLTCKHHPELRWTSKSIAWSSRPTQDDPKAGYWNGSRNIFFNPPYPNNDGVMECSCKASELILAPEETGVDESEAGQQGYTAEGRPI